MSNSDTGGVTPAEAAASLMDKLDLGSKPKVITKFRTIREEDWPYLEVTYKLPLSLPLNNNSYTEPVTDYLNDLGFTVDSVVGFDHTLEGITISVRYGDEIREVFLPQHERVVTEGAE